MEFFQNKGIEKKSGSDKENKKESVRDTKIIGTGKSITDSVSKATKIAKDKFTLIELIIFTLWMLIIAIVIFKFQAILDIFRGI